MAATAPLGIALVPSTQPLNAVEAGGSFRSQGVVDMALGAARSMSGSHSAHEREAPLNDEAPPPRCTSNIKTLGLTATLFISITCAQLVAAKVAHSQALLVDCISMAVDGLTFLCNIFVECKKKDGLEHIRSQLVVTAISLSCLTFFTIDALRESFDTAQVCWKGGPPDDDDDDVNPYIVGGFALGGLVFDIVSLIAFHRSNHKEGGGSRQLNMCTALLHVGADCLRSVTTLVLSIFILNGFDGKCSDGYASLIVGATILLGAAGGIFSWFKKLCAFLRGSPSSSDEERAADSRPAH